MILMLFWIFANRHNLLGLRRFTKIQNNVKSEKPRPNGVLQLPHTLKNINLRFLVSYIALPPQWVRLERNRYSCSIGFRFGE